MSLTRKMLKAMGIEEEKVDQIIEAHAETVDALKAERDEFKADAAKLHSVQKELDELREKGDGGFEAKYKKEHEDFEAFKAEIEAEKAKSEKEALYKQLLLDAGVDSKRIEPVMKVTDWNAISVKDGKLENEAKLTEAAKQEWGAFIQATAQQGAPTDTPPASAGGEKEPHSLAEALRQKYNAE